MVKILLSGCTIYLRFLVMKGCDAVRPGLDFFYFDDNFPCIALWVLAFSQANCTTKHKAHHTFADPSIFHKTIVCICFSFHVIHF